MESGSQRAMTSWGELVLQVRAGPPPSAALILEGLFLMDSESGASERALAQRGVARLGEVRGGSAPASVQVLVGGLGLGITLRALLDEPVVGQVQVVELFEELVTWNREHLGFLNAGALADPRVSVTTGDVHAFLHQEPRPVDLILFDVDNGPTMLSLPANRALYTPEGLTRIRRWLAPRGVAVFWATEEATAFERALDAQAGASWSKETIDWRPERGGREFADVLYYLVAGGAPDAG
jgi:spermidine synthase